MNVQINIPDRLVKEFIKEVEFEEVEYGNNLEEQKYTIKDKYNFIRVGVQKIINNYWIIENGFFLIEDTWVRKHVRRIK